MLFDTNRQLKLMIGEILLIHSIFKMEKYLELLQEPKQNFK